MTRGIRLVIFVNFVQLKALEEADKASCSAISTWNVPRIAAGCHHALNLTVLSGALLLVTTRYLLGDLFFSSSV